jgi:hypothetical protein
MWARAQTSGALQAPVPNQPGTTLAAAVPVSDVVVQLPNNAESLIQSVTVTANGQNLDAGPGNLYNQLFILISDVQMGGKKNERAITQLGADVPSITYPIVPGQGGAPPTGGYPSQAAQPSSSQFGNILPVPTIYTSVVGGTGTSNPGTYDGNNQQVLAILNWLEFSVIHRGHRYGPFGRCQGLDHPCRHECTGH